MNRVRYPAEFKAEAVKQVTQRGHGVVDVAKRLGMSDKSLYLWVRLAQEQQGVGSGENATLKAEVSRLKVELKRANEERDILKKAALDSTGECNTCSKFSAGRFISQSFAWPGVQFQSDSIKLSLVKW